jgi:small subunit ribosomal protein S1
MPNPTSPESPANTETTESFNDLLTQYEREHARKSEDGRKQLEGTVVSVTADAVYLDIGYKSEGMLPLTAFPEPPKLGDKFPVSVKGRDTEGYYELSRTRVELPKDWSALERAYVERATIMGTVTGVVKGGLSVDVGVRAFMPASRSGTKDPAELERMIGQEIRCRIIKLDVADEDVVVDHRAVAEEEERATKAQRYGEVKEGDLVTGTVRSLTDYGAFVDIGGVDALLHVGDISWSRVAKPADVLAVGQQIEAKVLKVDTDKKRISIGAKQLLAHPWDAATERYKPGDRVRGTVTRIVDFGAFVELEPGVEGLIHISELSWTRRIKRVSEVVKEGDAVEAVVLNINAADRRISLGLKQAIGDPWKDATERFAPGTIVEGPVSSIEKFGAFVQIAEGVEGMVHVSEISAERRIEHPRDVLKVGQIVRTQVIALDPEKRQVKLSMKQLIPTGIDEYLAEHKPGDVVTGRIIDVKGELARVELGEGIHATCKITGAAAQEEKTASAKADLSSLTSMLNAKWKSGAAPTKPQEVTAGQIRSFRMTSLDPKTKKIEVELA